LPAAFLRDHAVKDENLRKLVDEHYDRLFRAARFMCGDLSVAEDLAQETFLAAAESLKTFEGRSSTYTWLYGILLNKFRRWLRRRGVRALSLQAIGSDDEGEHSRDYLQADQPGPGELAERREAAGLVRTAIQGLEADHRSVVMLRYVEEMSYSEIAEVLDCPIGTVKSRLHYALRKIGRRLGRAGPTAH
jgi:RNA polymerase sigma-70 factor (ECF subfamily)